MRIDPGGTEVRSYIRIHYTSDTIQDYTAGLTAANNLQKLQDHVMTYRRVADDALKIVQDMGPKDFIAWRKGLADERKGNFAGEEFADKYGAVMMPEILLRVGMIASKYMVPWGLAYIRCMDAGHIVERDRIARWVNSPPNSGA